MLTPSSSANFSARSWLSALCICGLLGTPDASTAQQLDADILKKTKEATVHLNVKMVDSSTAEGSGFLTEEAGLVVTNAHVIGMMDADSRKPAEVTITLSGGTPQSRSVKATILGVDRGTDLALLRMEGKDFPAPLKLGSAANLTETETAFVFGYPFGKKLGAAVTVSKSSVSSIRKKGTRIDRVQLEGGLNPGNSGGPVVDAKGNVVGVSVSKIGNTQVGFAIPAEDVARFFNGRYTTSHYETQYKDGDKIVLPMRLDVVDPLGRIKKASIELWTGDPGPNRTAGAKQPAPAPGDSPIITKDFTYDPKAQSMSIDAALPERADPKHVFYYRIVLTNGLNETRWSPGFTLRLRTPVERIPVELKYAPPAKQTAEMVSKGSFRIRPAEGDEQVLDVDFKTIFTETFRARETKFIPMRLNYNQFLLTIKRDEKPLQSMPEALKMLQDVRSMAAEIEMDLDGSMGRSKEDLTKIPKASQGFFSDLSDQVLQSLEIMTVPLPSKKLEPKEKWKGQRNIVIGNAFVSVPASVDITYTYVGVQKEKGKADGRDVALVAVEGDIRPRRGGGPEVYGTYRTLAYISLETGEVIQSSATLKAELDIAIAKRPAKAIAMMSVSIAQPAPPPSPTTPPKKQ
jgi:S1-C subfamily serine protease